MTCCLSLRWALGCLLYECYRGVPPFHDERSEAKVFERIVKSSSNLAFPDNVPRDGAALIRKLLQRELSKRYGNMKGGVQDIKKHECAPTPARTQTHVFCDPSPFACLPRACSRALPHARAWWSLSRGSRVGPLCVRLTLYFAATFVPSTGRTCPRVAFLPLASSPSLATAVVMRPPHTHLWSRWPWTAGRTRCRSRSRRQSRRASRRGDIIILIIYKDGYFF